MKVFKFGGASVKDAPSFANIIRVLKLFENQQLFIVISAMGKMTNAFEKLHSAYFDNINTMGIFDEIYTYHINIARELFLDSSETVFSGLENLFDEIKSKLNTPPSKNYNFEYDRLVCYGELLSSHILSCYLNKNGFSNCVVDARSIIRTDANYREARVDWEKTPLLVKAAFDSVLESGKKIAVSQGFIGATAHNYTTTLGREGSDFTAAVVAFSLKAEDVTIWKDVPGVLNADPKQFSDTKKIDRLSYLDAIELAYYGATVIHPKTIKPLENAKIPLYVKSFLNPEGTGTVIEHFFTEKKPIPCFIFKTNQILISIQPRDFSFIAEQNISNIFQSLARYNIKANLMQNSAVSFSVCTDYDNYKTLRLIEELKKDFKVYYNTDLELVTIRHYNDSTIAKVVDGKKVLLEQKSRNTAQMILKRIKQL